MRSRMGLSGPVSEWGLSDFPNGDCPILRTSRGPGYRPSSALIGNFPTSTRRTFVLAQLATPHTYLEPSGARTPRFSSLRPPVPPYPRRRARRRGRRCRARCPARRRRAGRHRRGDRPRRSREEGDRDEAGVERGELLARLEGPVQVHRGHRRRPRLHRRHHRLLLRHRRHARPRPALRRPQVGQRAGQVPARAAQGQRQRLALRARPGLPQGLAQGRAGHGVPDVPGRRARPRLLRPRRRPGQDRRTARPRPVLLLRRHRHARRRRRLHQFPQHPQARPAHRQASGAGRRRDGVPQRLPRRPGLGHEAGGGPQRHHPCRHRTAGLPAQGQPRPEDAARLEGVRGQLPHRLTAARDYEGYEGYEGCGGPAGAGATAPAAIPAACRAVIRWITATARTAAAP
ncbi:protein of unknown function [Streptomyces murinus]